MYTAEIMLCTIKLFCWCRGLVCSVIGLDKHKVSAKSVNIFLPIIFNICFGYSKELSHCDGSFEYPQHMFWLGNKKIIFLVRTLNLRPECVFVAFPDHSTFFLLYVSL